MRAPPPPPPGRGGGGGGGGGARTQTPTHACTQEHMHHTQRTYAQVVLRSPAHEHHEHINLCTCIHTHARACSCMHAHARHVHARVHMCLHVCRRWRAAMQRSIELARAQQPRHNRANPHSGTAASTVSITEHFGSAPVAETSSRLPVETTSPVAFRTHGSSLKHPRSYLIQLAVRDRTPSRRHEIT